MCEEPPLLMIKDRVEPMVSGTAQVISWPDMSVFDELGADTMFISAEVKVEPISAEVKGEPISAEVKAEPDKNTSLLATIDALSKVEPLPSNIHGISKRMRESQEVKKQHNIKKEKKEGKKQHKLKKEGKSRKQEKGHTKSSQTKLVYSGAYHKARLFAKREGWSEQEGKDTHASSLWFGEIGGGLPSVSCMFDTMFHTCSQSVSSAVCLYMINPCW